jgi:signal transduction histidine kinase
MGAREERMLRPTGTPALPGGPDQGRMRAGRARRPAGRPTRPGGTLASGAKNCSGGRETFFAYRPGTVKIILQSGLAGPVLVAAMLAMLAWPATAAAAAMVPPPAPPLATLSAVRALTAEEAGAGLAVRVEGVVLGIEPGSRVHFFLHDGEAGCFVKVRGGQPGGLAPADRVLVVGTTDPLGFYPSIRDARVTPLGRGGHPPPVRPGPSRLFAPELDSAWVDVPAVITGYEAGDDRFTLSVEVHGLPFKAELPLEPDSAVRASVLLLRPARLHGVMGTIFNHQRQMTDRHFFVPSLDFILPLAGAGPEEAPQPRSIARLLAGDTGPHLRVRIVGTVTQTAAGGFYLRDDSGSTFVQAAGGLAVAPGQVVEVEGYAAVAPFRPVVRASRVAATGILSAVAPIPFDPPAADPAPLHAERVTLVAEFLGSHRGRRETILQFQSGGRFFEALLPGDAGPAAKPRPGDRVRLDGICELTTTHALPRPAWVDGFRIHLPAGGGLAIVARAPWWNTRRLLMALGLTSGAAATGLLATWVLRRQVKHQLAVISGRLRAEAVAGERDRMARELHDTLEQQLSGVALQLDSLDHAVRENPAAATETLSLARRMLRFTRAEARRSVWDLRSQVLEEEGLAAALRALGETTAAAGGPRVEVQVTGAGGVLPPRVDFHLLRIAQEAATNALKHARARRIDIHLDHQPARVALTIRDDGDGFDPAAAGQARPAPHFGLLGMRERAARIGALIEVDSAPGRGCTVRVTKDLEAQPPAP